MNDRIISEEDFVSVGLAAGFTEEQLDFMWNYLAKMPHTHSIEEVEGLEEELEELEGEEEEGEEEG